MSSFIEFSKQWDGSGQTGTILISQTGKLRPKRGSLLPKVSQSREESWAEARDVSHNHGTTEPSQFKWGDLYFFFKFFSIIVS